MLETKYTAVIKNLFQEYYKRNISMGEYRAQRKRILDQMDEEYNGTKNIEPNGNQADDQVFWLRLCVRESIFKHFSSAARNKGKNMELVKFFQSGGAFMYPILVVMALGLAIALDRLLYLSRTAKTTTKIWKQINPTPCKILEPKT